ncbi:Hypothetical_protein [Hexamita inflata]|uniref:Hypothetical_protein n=1 Tax=Hexamita inflata TaxID=28002 RepID=A0AA86UA52_9EUKA|nr:Hypothetical protein HINF_LOCUS32341 [Hexamita inflata]
MFAQLQVDPVTQYLPDIFKFRMLDPYPKTEKFAINVNFQFGSNIISALLAILALGNMQYYVYPLIIQLDTQAVGYMVNGIFKSHNPLHNTTLLYSEYIPATDMFEDVILNDTLFPLPTNIPLFIAAIILPVILDSKININTLFASAVIIPHLESLFDKVVILQIANTYSRIIIELKPVTPDKLPVSVIICYLSLQLIRDTFVEFNDKVPASKELDLLNTPYS